jgi:Flp pilus assembly protein protease CpaA
MNLFDILTLVLLFLVLLSSSIYDIKYRKIPNNLLILFLFLKIMVNLYYYNEIKLDFQYLSFLGILIIILFLLDLTGQIGGGDFKLIILIGFYFYSLNSFFLIATIITRIFDYVQFFAFFFLILCIAHLIVKGKKFEKVLVPIAPLLLISLIGCLIV